MQLTIYLIVGLLAAAAKSSFANDDSSSNQDSKFPNINFPTFPTFPQFTFPTFPTLPTIPTFPTIPPIAFPQMQKGNNGVVVSSSSSAGVGKDGKEYNSGGATIVVRNNGVEKKYTIGDAPPNVSIPNWQSFFQEPFMTMGDKTANKQRKNGHFVSSSASAFSSTSTKNGVTRMTGAANVKHNVNGKINERTIHVSNNEV